MTGENDRMRVDVFLWRARFFKTRTAASDAVENRGLRIERDGQVRRIDKPAMPVEEGDLLSFSAPSGAKIIRVLSLPARRGPPAEAALCYEAMTGSGGGASEKRGA
jgi:ribosome-associated heat shock protein Hsp15